LAFSPDSALFGPPGGDIGAIEGESEHAEEGGAAVGDGIGFEEAGARFVPVVGLDGDLVTEESAGFGGGAAAFFVMGADGEEESVDGGGRDEEEGLGDFWREKSEGLYIAG